MKRVVNSNKPLFLTVAKEKDPDKTNDVFDLCPNDEVLEKEQASQWGGKKKKISMSHKRKSIDPQQQPCQIFNSQLR